MILLILLCLSSYTVLAQPEIPNTNIWLPNQPVTALGVYGDYMYIAGNFSYVAPNTGKVASFSTETGAPNFKFPHVNGNVYSIISDGNNGWYIGGSFTHVGGLERNGLARVGADGLVYDWNPNVSGEVRTILLSETNLYIGGIFTKVGGVTLFNAAKLSTVTGAIDHQWKPMFNNVVHSIAMGDGYIFVGGDFNLPRKKIAKIHSVYGSVDTTWNAISTNEIKSIVVDGNDLFFGYKTIQKVNLTTGVADHLWQSPVSGAYVEQIFIHNNKVYAAGSGLGGNAGLAKYGRVLGNLEALANEEGNISSCFVYDNNIYAGGSNYLRKFTPSLAAYQNWKPYIFGSGVYAIHVTNNRVVAGGSFWGTEGYWIQKFTRINNKTGKVDPEWNITHNGRIDVISADSNFVYVGGEFTNIGGKGVKNLARISTLTGMVDNWYPIVNNSIRVITLDYSHVYIGGDFVTVGGVIRSRIARIPMNSTHADDWNPDAHDNIYDIKIEGEDVYVSGNFNFIGGLAKNNIARLSKADGKADSTFNLSVTGSGGKLVISNDYLYSSGTFTVDGFTRRMGKIRKSDGAYITGWVPSPNGTVTGIVEADNYIYTGGYFGMIGGQQRRYLAKLDKETGAAVAGWDPSPNKVITSMTKSEGDIYAIGLFDKMKGASLLYIALFTDRILSVFGDIRENNQQPIEYNLSQNYPNPFNPTTKIQYTVLSEGEVDIRVYDLLGREIALLVNEVKGIGEYEIEFDGKGLSSGVYFYKLNINNKPIQIKKMILLK